MVLLNPLSRDSQDLAKIYEKRLSALSSIRAIRVIPSLGRDSTRRVDSVRERRNGGGNVCPLRYRGALIAVRECSTCLSTHSGPVDKSVDRLPLSLDVGENDAWIRSRSSARENWKPRVSYTRMFHWKMKDCSVRRNNCRLSRDFFLWNRKIL